MPNSHIFFICAVVLILILSTLNHLNILSHPIRVKTAYLAFRKYYRLAKKENRLARKADRYINKRFNHGESLGKANDLYMKSQEVGLWALVYKPAAVKAIDDLIPYAPIVAHYLKQKLRML